ncbi:MAG: RidA family protein [Burkholderiales bacterium]|nr:RidA family protein [Burkholderiales bacterium]
MVRAFDPPSIPKPSGSYTHGIEVDAGTRLLFVAGQTPGRSDGSIPDTIEEQLDVVWQRIGAVLAGAGMGYSDLVKVQTFVTRTEYLPKTSAARLKYLGSHRPTATLVCITQLADPRYMVEIEVIAARA